MSAERDFYNRVCEIHPRFPVPKRRNQLAEDIASGVLVPTKDGCAALFDRIGILKQAHELDMNILSALIEQPLIFKLLRDYSVTGQCASAFVQLGLTAKLFSVTHEVMFGMEFWTKFVAVLETVLVFNYAIPDPCNLYSAPRGHLKRVSVYDPKRIAAAKVVVPHFIVSLYNYDKAAVALITPQDAKMTWWRVGVSRDTGDQFLLMAMAAYACPSGPWPLSELPLRGSTLSQFRANYLSAKAHVDTLAIELNRGKDAAERARNSLMLFDNHHLAQTVLSRMYGLRGEFLSVDRDVVDLKFQLRLDCERVFQRVWADACDTILAMQRGALTVCGQTLPHYIVLDLLRLIDDGVTVLVDNEARLIALIKERTNRACAIHEIALTKQCMRDQDDQLRHSVSQHAASSTRVAKKRTFDDVSVPNTTDKIRYF